MFAFQKRGFQSKHFLGLIAVILTATTSSGAQVRFADSQADAIGAFLDKNFSNSNSGMVIGLIDEHGSRIFSAGKLDNGTGTGIDGNTVFELGSVTKVFTVLLLMDAVQRNEMRLDDPVGVHLPQGVQMPVFGKKQITLLNLAGQDSSLPRFPRDYSGMSIKEIKSAADAFTVNDLYTYLSHCRLSHEPGARFTYSNVGMSLLGHVIEKTTGEDYDSLVTKRICKPLGLKSTRVSLSSEQNSRLARGHWANGSRSEHLNFKAMASAGSLNSTANDVLTFLSAQLSLTPTRLTPLMDQMTTVRHPKSDRFGKTAIPWHDEGVYNPAGTELWGHAGGGFGNLAFTGFDKKKRRGVVVLTNQMNIFPNGIGWTLLQGMPFTRANIAYAVRKIIGLGMGIKSNPATGDVHVTRVYTKAPAGMAGVLVGDTILKINGVSVKGKTTPECIAMLGGTSGTKVQLELHRPNESKMISLELTRMAFLTSG